MTNLQRTDNFRVIAFGKIAHKFNAIRFLVFVEQVIEL